ncbi:MYLK-like protein, partial [Mya arenaria]
MIKCREAEKKKIHLEIEIMNQLKHPKILMLWDAFEAPRKMILVMEYLMKKANSFIGGGELFERILDDDCDLLERDCIQFMRQICDAVHYMHSRNILHLDLKPENVLCIKNESNKIKIIDFGLARYYEKGESVRVLFGTPEFIAPEVVNYDEIGFTTDMWSVGVICYVLLTGFSPFMGDSDAETLANVTHGEYDMDEEDFQGISQDGKDYINSLLVKNK